MADRIALGAQADEGEQIEVELWGRVFTTRPVTRSVQKQIDELDKRLNEAADSDEAIGLFADLIGALTVPTGGQKKTAAAVIREKWEADELSVGQIAAFAEQVQEAATSRPT